MTWHESYMFFDEAAAESNNSLLHTKWRETMAAQMARVRCVKTEIVFWFVIVAFTAIAGCASEKPKAMQQPSPEQLKGSADRSFDKLKQEERERKSTGQ